MGRMRSLLVVALASSACLYGREVSRESVVSPPPAPPGSDSDTSYQTQAPPPPAGSEVADDEVFYSGLSPYGTWTFVAPYGRVWIPAVGSGWRPYYYGRWVLTDWGWTFVSDDPWGWAAYHYGRWNWAVGFGWYWIPGLVWGPAWVSWRYGGGYSAWCPLGPPGVYFGYRHPGWVAVDNVHFTHPIARVALPPHAVAGVVTQTQPLGGPHAIARSGSFGPPVAAVQRAVGAPIPRVPAAQVVARAGATSRPVAASGGAMRSPLSPRSRTLGSAGDLGRGPPAAQPTPRPSAQPIPRSYGSPQSPSRPGAGSSSPRPARSYGGGSGAQRPYGGGSLTPRPYGGHGFGQPASRPYGGGGGGGVGAGGGGGGRSAPAASSSRGGGQSHASGKSK
jgi:hypothetical protein